MPIENDFLPFAAAGGANVLTQQQYAALTTLLANGFSSGVAQSAQLNKVWRQSSIMASVLAQFIVDNSSQPAIDDGTTATLEANLLTSIKTIVAADASKYALDSGAADAYVAAYVPPVTSLTDGMVRRFKAKAANTGASTLAVDGLAASAILGAAHSALQGGEIVANGDVLVQWNSSLNAGAGAWVLIEATGGAVQIAPAAQTNQAVNLGQFTGALSNIGYVKFPNGLIQQWGNAVTGADGIAITFPVAFPRAAFNLATGTVVNAGNTSQSAVLNTGNPTTTGFTAYGSVGNVVTGVGFYWLATGW